MCATTIPLTFQEAKFVDEYLSFLQVKSWHYVLNKASTHHREGASRGREACMLLA
jgi:hypothetical protein